MSSTMENGNSLYARIAELEKENEELKKENEALQKEDNKRFLNKYLVSNLCLLNVLVLIKEHFAWAEEWSDDKWYDFKEYVIKWACTGELNEIMEELMKNFESDYDEDDEDIDEDTVVSGIFCKMCQTVLPPLTTKEHLDINNPINKCPHVKDPYYFKVCDK